MKKCWILLFVLLPMVAFAGKLKDFEKAASPSSTAPSSPSSSSSSSSYRSSYSDPTITLFDLIFAVLIGPPSSYDSSYPYATTRGNLHGNSLAEVNKSLRQNHSFALPNFRLDGIYQYDTDGVHAAHVKAEAGFLMVGVDVDYTRYFEGPDRFNNLGTHGLLRIPLGNDFMELDVALGYRRLWGDQVHQGFDFGLPFYINFGRYAQMDLRYYVTYLGGSRPMQEVDIGIAGKYKWLGTRLGYRAINVTGVTLQGPEFGAFFQW